MIGLIGGAAGVFIGNLIVGMMGITGVPFQSPFGSGTIYIFPTISILITLFILSLAIFICVVSAWIPATRATKIEPVKAFRGQIT